MAENSSSSKNTWITVFGGIAAVVVAAVFTWYSPKAQEYFNKKYHVIVLSTKLEDEAIRKAKQLAAVGYPAAVYSCSNGYFAVSLGEYSKSKAHAVEKEVVSKQNVRTDTYLASSDGLVRKIYPSENKSDSKTEPKTEIKLEKKYYIIAYSSKNVKRAKQYLQRFKKHKFNPLLSKSVRKTSNGLCAVVLGGEYSFEDTRKILDNLLKANIVEKGSYIADDGIGEEIPL